MKISEAWLREWVDPPIGTRELAAQLTMAGLEVGSIEPAAAPFSGVVLGRVLSADPHPNADKLRLCTVDTGNGEPRSIVCGASNVATGQLVAVAEVGARLPGGLRIRKAKLRGVESAGMICSATELGLGDEAEGILVLPEGGCPGTPLQEYLELDDDILELDLTPNRGDCLSVVGIAREVAVVNELDFAPSPVAAVTAATQERVPIRLESERGCPIYAGRVISGIDNTVVTPLWMQERLRRSGLRPVNPVVDVTNYVMLETGQPLHGFDMRHIDAGIVVRQAVRGESLILLDGRELELDEDVLVIADHSRALALAGIMGGESSGVADDTTSVFLESAFFDPPSIAGRARRYGLHTDASHRFERGVAPGGQVPAIERATALLLEIVGGSPGPVELALARDDLTQRPLVNLRRERLARVLGHRIDDARVSDILRRLHMEVTATREGWSARPPAFRFDITIEADLIEEVARIYGYDNLPEANLAEPLPFVPSSEGRVSPERLKDVLVGRGYREAITYSFVDPALHERLSGDRQALRLANPISSDLAVMRTTLWPGLIQVLKSNLSRQQERVRIFETGLRFLREADEIKQETMLAGLWYGDREPEQWGSQARPVDFYDLKADVEATLALTGRSFVFEAGQHPTLHPGQCARIRVTEGRHIGWLGALHPAHARALSLPKAPLLFEILVEAAFRAKIPAFEAVSRYPSLRRDISFVVDEGTSAAQILDCVRGEAPERLRDAFVFDVYRDQGIDSGRKSIALGLILQDNCRTLTDGEADAIVDEIRHALVTKLRAKIRD